MDAEDQKNHLKAYGVAYASLKLGVPVDWLLNYKGGSFAMDGVDAVERLCKLRGVSYDLITDAQYTVILQQIADPNFNGDVIKLEKAPRVAVYTPSNKLPWDDAVTMVLTYAEIPYDKVYDDELLDGKLADYDWLHLHHEDFSGQYGKFWYAYQNAAWYMEDVRTQEAMAKKHGYKKVSQLKLDVAKKIRDFVLGGGYLFAMCSATDSYDIALAAQNTDICETPFDGDPMAPDAQQRLDYTQCFAFKDFTLERNPTVYEYSNIDNTLYRRVYPDVDYFSPVYFLCKV